MIRLLNNSDTGLVLDYCHKYEIETVFLIGNINLYGINNNKNIKRCGDYFGYFENEELKGIIAFYNLGSVIPHFTSQGAISYIVELLNDRNFQTLLGVKRIVNPLLEQINRKIDKFNDSFYLINKNPVEFYNKDLLFKNQKEIDIKKAISFIIEAEKFGFESDVTEEYAINKINECNGDEELLFGLVNNEIVSQAFIQSTTENIAMIGGVYTSLYHRGKGYAKATVYELCKRIISKGKIPVLSVRKNNTPAYKAYLSIGFEYYDDYLLIDFK